MEDPPSSFDNLDMTCVAAGTVAAEVRQRIEFRLDGWGLHRLADDIHLVATELITNACAATPMEQIRIRFTREAHSVFLGVWDSSDVLPRMRQPEELELDRLTLSPEAFDDNGGWGLHLVRTLSSEFGVIRTQPYGKWMWSRFTVKA